MDNSTIQQKGRPFSTRDTPDKVQGQVVPLTLEKIVLGREPSCQVILDSLMVSRMHAEILVKNGRVRVRDLGSTNGTAVNGVAISRTTELTAGDRIAIGPYQFAYNGESLIIEPATLGLEVRVTKLDRTVKNMQTGKPLKLLDGVSFTIPPRSFVGLLGPSGCGKSTLMDALNGRRRATGGKVLFNNFDLYAQFDAFKAGIGYVPQEVIFHDTLPLGEALRYASRLRLSSDVSVDEIEDNITRVLETVGLSERRGTVIRHLSGGQKKRVSIAIELLSDPDILFLDEVTSGLDLGTEKEMMELFRKLADSGKTIICITHFLESLSQCDKVICLMRGKLVFDGKPQDMKRHFEIDEMREVYGLEKKATPDEWAERFLGTHEGQAQALYADNAPEAGHSPPGRNMVGMFDLKDFLLQFRILTQRYIRLLLLDRNMFILLLLLAPIIGGMLCMYAQSIDVPDKMVHPKKVDKPDQSIAREDMASQVRLERAINRVTDEAAEYEEEIGDIAADYRSYYTRQRTLLFGSCLAAIFLAMFASVQEIVKELPIYFHERFVKLQLGPYLLSKILPLSALGGAQTFLLLGTIHLFADIDAGSFVSQFVVLFMMSLVGMLLGLVISAAVPGSKESANIAVLLMIAIVIPQLLFSGGLGPLEGIAESIGQGFIACYWGLEALTSNIGREVPSSSQYAAFSGMDSLVGEKYWMPVFVLVAHCVFLFTLLVALMLRKDGPEAIQKLRLGMKQLAEKAGL